MSRKIVITTDYEIFGNGTGDVRQHVTGPAETMARVAERHGVPINVFFELEETLSFSEHAEALRGKCGYDPGEEMRRQAADLSRRGHDVQLHLHPQWVGASYDDNKGWNLNHDRLTVDALFESQEETTAYVASRKEALESITGRPVVAYRAGGFAAQPAGKLLRALAESGFAIESSVVRGLYREKPCPLDYRCAPAHRRMWRVRDDVCREDSRGLLWELPVHSVMRRRLHQVTPRRLLAKFSGNVPKARQKEMVDQLGLRAHPVALARILCQPVPIKLDFDNLTPRELMRMIRSAPEPIDGDLDVLVLIGHTKEHTRSEPFEAFVKQVAAAPDIEAVTLTDVAEMLKARPEGLLDERVSMLVK